MTADPCTTARQWLSTSRDGETGSDPGALAHLDGCADCGVWADTLDQITRVSRLRAPAAGVDLRVAVAGLAVRHVDPALRSARMILALAAISSVAAVVLSMLGAVGHFHLGSPEGRDAEALVFALTGGFALTAWRPARLAAGLLPVAVLAALVTGVTSAMALAAGDSSVAHELPHLPILIGAVGSAFAYRATLPPKADADLGEPMPA